MKLENKVAIVSGSSKGLGLSISRKLLNENCKVIGLSRSGTPINDENFEGYKVDVSKEEQVKDACKKVIEKYGRVDVLINNAGFGAYDKLEEMDSSTIRDMFDTNVLGIFYLIRSVIPSMKRNQQGHIVNISSIAGLVGMEKLSVYNATKFAVKGLSEALFKELRPDGIKVTCIFPGSIETNFFDDIEGLSSSNKMDADEVAEAIVYNLKSSSSMHPVNLELRPFGKF